VPRVRATTALDVTTQAQIMELLLELQAELGMALMLISHDLGLAASYADEVIVMYAGRIVEQAPATRLFSRVRMPYTQALLEAIPRLERPAHSPLPVIGGRPPDLSALPAGCSFAPRCRYAADDCRAAEPPLAEHEPGHRWAGAAGQISPAGAAGQISPAGAAGQISPAGAAGQISPAGAAGQISRVISGEPPSPVHPPSGCRFRTRCPRAQEVCAAEQPPMRELPAATGGPGGPAATGGPGGPAATGGPGGRAGHTVACHFPLASQSAARTTVRSDEKIEEIPR
jgi:oligopeptide/dipeptide ABC transporter ATP-binding protein